MYNQKCNGQVERLNRTILADLVHIISDNLNKWDQFTDKLTFEYNKQVHRTKKKGSFWTFYIKEDTTFGIWN